MVLHARVNIRRDRRGAGLRVSRCRPGDQSGCEVVYFDTGYNVSFIDPAFSDGLARVERAGKFKMFLQSVPMEIGGHTFVFIVTVDIRAKKLVLATAE